MKNSIKFFSVASLILIIWSLLFSVNVKAMDTDLVLNGGFELGESNWDSMYGASILEDPDGIMNGDKFAYMGFGDDTSYIKQEGLSLPADAISVKLRFQFRFWKSTIGDSNARVVLENMNTSSNYDEEVGIIIDEDSGDNKYYAEIELMDLDGINYLLGKDDLDLSFIVDNWSYNGNARLLVDDVSITVTTPTTSNPVNLYRFWSDQGQGHFYTASGQEKNSVITGYSDDVWRYENIAYQVYEMQVSETTPVYRFWSDQNQGHFYTASEEERDYVINNYPEDVWKYEGEAYYVYPTEQSGTKAVYRFWSKANQHHFYTASEEERNYVINNYPEDVWKYEGVAWYVNE